MAGLSIRQASLTPAGIVRRISALLLDLSVCSWIIARCLSPMASRYRARLVEILGLRTFQFAIDAGTAKLEEVSNLAQSAIEETIYDLQEMNVVFALAALIVSCLVLVGYYVLCEASPFSTTFGKALFGLRVYDDRNDTPHLFRIIARQFLKSLTVATFFLGYFGVFWSPHGKALHDWLAGTRVFYRRSLASRLFRWSSILIIALFIGSATYSSYQRYRIAWNWYQVIRANFPLFPDLADSVSFWIERLLPLLFP